MPGALTADLRDLGAGSAPAPARWRSSDDDGLLALKGRPAGPSPLRISRDRVVRRLLEARDVPVVLVIAPAGYGKTSVLCEWADRDHRPCAWVTLDAADDEPVALLAALAFALDAVEPVGWAVFEALSSGRPDAPAVALRRLARSLRSWKTPCLVAVDDVHVLSPVLAREWLLPLASALPGGSALALAGRGDSSLPVGRLRVEHRSLELGSEDLAMTRSEAAELVRQGGMDLPPDAVVALVHRTGGWPAALSLATRSLREKGTARAEAAGLGGADRVLAQYVQEEFLAGLEPEQIGFLTRTSVLGELSGPFCDAVLQVPGSADMLSRLARSNVPLAPVGHSGALYRYNGLFAEALKQELHRREPGRATVLHQRASEWCEGRGDSNGAIHHAIAAPDVPLAARLIFENAVAGLGHREETEALLAAFSDREICSQPLLALVSAAGCLFAGDLDATACWTAVADDAPGGSALVGAGVAIMRACLAREGVAAMGDEAARARDLLPAGSDWDPLCRFLEGTALHLGGERDRARAALTDGAHRAAVRAPLVQALCLAQLALVTADAGDFERAGILAGRARAQAQRSGREDCPLSALVFAVSAALRAERGEAGQARRDAERSTALLAQIVEPAGWFATECTELLAQAELRASGPPAAAGWSLTAAELRLLGYLPTHLSFREIAACLFVSPNTVKTHARGIYRKLGVSCRARAVDEARSAGLVDPAGLRLADR